MQIRLTRRQSITVACGGSLTALFPSFVKSAEYDVQSQVMGDDKKLLLLDRKLVKLKSLLLVTCGVDAANMGSKLPYNSAKTLSYAVAHCRSDNDCAKPRYNLDCTHFMCHALQKGGVCVNTPSAQCPTGLAIRVGDLAAAFSNAKDKYSNVSKISTHGATRRGDFCFIPGWFGLTKEHVMLLADTATANGAKVYAHSNDRCGEFVSFEGEDCMYYRIEDSSHGMEESAIKSSREELAQLILDDDGITLASNHSSGNEDDATALDNIKDTAAGNRAKRSSYGNAPGGETDLHKRLLSGMIALSQNHDYTYSVSELAGGSHSKNSRHYVGVAMDVNKINGQRVSSQHPDVENFMEHCEDLGATEVLGPGDPDHDTHIHAAWPRPTYDSPR